MDVRGGQGFKQTVGLNVNICLTWFLTMEGRNCVLSGPSLNFSGGSLSNPHCLHSGLSGLSIFGRVTLKFPKLLVRSVLSLCLLARQDYLLSLGFGLVQDQVGQLVCTYSTPCQGQSKCRPGLELADGHGQSGTCCIVSQ